MDWIRLVAVLASLWNFCRENWWFGDRERTSSGLRRDGVPYQFDSEPMKLT